MQDHHCADFLQLLTALFHDKNKNKGYSPFTESKDIYHDMQHQPVPIKPAPINDGIIPDDASR